MGSFDHWWLNVSRKCRGQSRWIFRVIAVITSISIRYGLNLGGFPMDIYAHHPLLNWSWIFTNFVMFVWSPKIVNMLPFEWGSGFVTGFGHSVFPIGIEMTMIRILFWHQSCDMDDILGWRLVRDTILTFMDWRTILRIRHHLSPPKWRRYFFSGGIIPSDQVRNRLKSDISEFLVICMIIIVYVNLTSSCKCIHPSFGLHILKSERYQVNLLIRKCRFHLDIICLDIVSKHKTELIMGS